MALIDVEIFKTAARNLRRQKLVSYLTLIGIIIGIAAVVALISSVQGLNNAVEKQFEKMGSTTIMVIPGGSLTESMLAKLQEDDADTVANVKGVEYATPLYVVSERAEFKGEKKTAITAGIDPAMQEKYKELGIIELAEGRELNSNEKYGILIGDRLAKGIFKEDISVRQRILLGEKELRVVGIIKPQGSAFGAVFNSAIIMNSEALKEISAETLTPYRIIAKAVKKDDIEETKQRVEDALKRKHGKKDFMLMTQGQIQESAASVLGIIQIVLIGIAAISLVAGGLGIMNTMFMAITERTKEIGVMKAVGATNTFVLTLFLAESCFIGFIGGIIGIAFGLSLSSIISLIATAAGFELEPYLGLDLILGALVFSVLIGTISGLIPSLRGARMEPVEALRDA